MTRQWMTWQLVQQSSAADVDRAVDLDSDVANEAREIHKERRLRKAPYWARDYYIGRRKAYTG